MTDYRQRIYEQYPYGRHQTIGGGAPAEAAVRDPYFQILVRDFFPMDRHVVIRELGAGQGVLLRILEKLGYKDVVGYDTSPQQISQALHLDSARLERGDAFQVLAAIPEGYIDVLVAFDLLEHFTKSEAIRLAEEAFRVLKPGGRWIIHCPNGESPFSGRVRYGDFTHETCYTWQSISQLLQSCGFVGIVCREDQPTVHGLISGARWICWRVIRSILRFYIAVETGFTGSGIVLSQNFVTLAFKPELTKVS